MLIKRFASAAFSVVLAVGLLPLPAFADETVEDAAVQLEPGTYVEHEAIAYVVDDGTGSRARAFSLGGDILAGAETLMSVDADAAAEALGDEAVAGEADDGEDAPAAASARARTLFAEDATDEPAGSLVLVRDESKTTEELIAELQADDRVLFAEPNSLVESCDEELSESAEQGGQVEGDGEIAFDGSSDPADGTQTSDSAQLSDQAQLLDGTQASDQPQASDAEDPDGNAESSDPDDPEAGDDPSSNEGEPGESSDSAEPTVFGSDEDEPASDMTAFQWGMSNNGSMGGVSSDEAVDIEYSGWNDVAAAGDLEEVVVAVIDSGVDETNPDLADVLWDEGETYPELTALGGDAHGISTVPGTTSTAPVSAEQGHGTHVAGIIAAEWNGQGVSGVAPNVKIMSARSEVDTASDMLRCVNYVTAAAKAGVNVRVANCSWGMGSSATRAFDIAFTQLGQAGVVAVFASGNSDSDMDATSNAISTLRDNPYVVTVDSIDPSGALSMFSCYGQATTDVVAPGTTILSTWVTSEQQYLGEEDADAALYESFDEATRAADGALDAEGAQVAGGASALQFSYAGIGGEVPVVEDRSFDGDASLELTYSVEIAQALGMTYGGYPIMVVQSTGIDLSGLSEKPRYLSYRMNCSIGSGEGGMPLVYVGVKTKDGGASDPIAIINSFGLGGDSWGGAVVELPENTDFEDFHLVFYYAAFDASITGGVQDREPADGVIYIDSIGLGSDLVPYKYTQGTSMAAPVVAGAAAVMAGTYTDDSAAQLAARVKGAAQGDAYAEVCSTGGYATVDGAAHPSPVPTEAEVSEDGKTVTVRGYFVPDDVQVSIGGAACAIVLSDDSAGGAGDDELTELVVQAPEGFAGGEEWVELAGGNDSGRVLVQFEAVDQEGGAGSQAAYYDETNLPVPEELDDWGGWQLVGFAGDVYALPQENEMNYNADHAFMMKYDPQMREWSRIATPSADQLAAAGVRNVASMAGTTYQGSLIVQITSDCSAEGSDFYTAGSYWRYTVDGAWEHIAVPSLDGETLSMSALGSDGENLYAFGGKGSYGYPNEFGEEGGEVKAILRLDLETGEAEQVGEMIRERHNAQVVYRDGAFLVAAGQNTAAQEASSMGVERISVLDEATEALSPTGETVEYPAGSLVSAPVRMSSLVTETGELAFAPAAVAGGFMVVGPRSDDGSADTYTVANEDGALPEAYGKIASDQRLLTPSALAYDGMLYVLASTTSDPYRVFSATAVETVAQPGDYVAPDPDPEPEPVPSPEIGSDSDTGSDSTLKKLASTGDFAIAPLALLGAAACAAGVAVVARRRAR